MTAQDRFLLAVLVGLIPQMMKNNDDFIETGLIRSMAVTLVADDKKLRPDRPQRN